MPRKIVVIDGHPDPDRSRFVHALADGYAEGAAATHEVRRLNVAELDFPLIGSQAEWTKGEPPPGIREAQESLRWADHIVLLYPLWLGDVPALLKGFLEQVMRPSFAFAYRTNKLPEKLLKGRSARIIVTMGMPSLFYRLVYRAHSLKSLERNILNFVGIKPVAATVVGSVEAGAEARRRWLDRMRELGRLGE
jgi:putative NADPH-quinone reductase